MYTKAQPNIQLKRNRDSQGFPKKRKYKKKNENETCAKHATIQLSAINTVCSSIVRPLVYNGNAEKRSIIIFSTPNVNAGIPED